MTGPGQVFPLLIFAAIQHPSADFRMELKNSIAKWIRSLKPKYEQSQICEALQGCKGTVLEPFMLKPEDQEITAMLVQAAFSEACNQTRFRIVSRETIGGDGGCVLTNNLRHYYIERFALGKRRRTPSTFWSYIPNNAPSDVLENLGADARNVGKLKNSLQVCVIGDDSGFRIELTGADLAALQWPESSRLSNLLQKNSVIGEKRETLDAMGLRVSVESGKISLIPASPEATMRMTAHMLSESLLMLDPGDESEGRFKIYIRMRLPDQDKQSLKAHVAATTGYFREWLNMDIENIPELSESHRITIARWLMPHDSWVNPQFLEVV